MLKRINIFFVTILLIGSSCSNWSEKDRSLTAEEYMDIGMPDYSRQWSLSDYAEACDVLDKIKSIKPLALPKKNSTRSGEYFDRIINTENMSFVLDETLTLKDRAYQIQNYIDIQSYLVTIYTDLKHPEQYYNRELIDLYIFGLTITQNMLDLGNQINQSVDDIEIEMQSRFQSIQYIHIKMILFVLVNQEKESIFEINDLEMLSDVISSSIQLNRDWMEDPTVVDIKKQLQDIVDITKSGHIKENYQMLIESI